MKANSQLSSLYMRFAKISVLLVFMGLIALNASLSLPTLSVQAVEPTSATPDLASSVSAAQSERCFQCPPTDIGGRGIQLFSTGKKIKVTILTSNAALTSNIYVRPGPMGAPRQFLGTNRDTGNMACLDFPAGTEYVFEIEAGGNTFQTGLPSRNPDNLSHAIIECQLDKPIISFEDLFGPGSDRDFNDVRLEISCCEDKCDFPLFYPPDYFLNDLHRMPRGAVFIGGVNYNAAVSTRNADAIREALEGGGLFGTNPLQQLNREYVAAQLSLAMAGGDGSPAAFNSLWSPLRCLGPVGQVTLGNGFVFNSNSMLKDLFLQTRLAILENRTADFGLLFNFFNDLHCSNPFPRPRGVCLPLLPLPDLLPRPTGSKYCESGGNKLNVTVLNSSSASVTACTVVSVQVRTGGTAGDVILEKQISSVPAFGSVPVTFDLPSFCSSGCSYRITVNSSNCPGSPKVLEARRSNNTVNSTCP